MNSIRRKGFRLPVMDEALLTQATSYTSLRRSILNTITDAREIHVEYPPQFAERFLYQPPAPTSAPQGGVRVYSPKPGVIVKTDPSVACQDRHGNKFCPTPWH